MRHDIELMHIRRLPGRSPRNSLDKLIIVVEDQPTIIAVRDAGQHIRAVKIGNFEVPELEVVHKGRAGPNEIAVVIIYVRADPRHPTLEFSCIFVWRDKPVARR